MSTPDVPSKDVATPAPADQQTPEVPQEQPSQAADVAVEITDIKASGLPAKVGFFGGLFYVRVKGGKVPQRTKTAKYTKTDKDEFVARWGDTVKLSGLESSKVEIEVYARKFFFSYKIIKKTESKESLADLLEHSETSVELELLEEGQAAGKLVFTINKSKPPVASSGGGGTGGGADTTADVTPPPTTDSPAPIPESGQKEETSE